jgi:hypothetical protein
VETWADEYGANLLYRASLFGVRTDGNRAGHQVLIPDVPKSIRALDQLIRGMSETDQETLFVWYALPVHPDTGNPLTKQEIATLLGITSATFRKRLWRAKKNIKNKLNF